MVQLGRVIALIGFALLMVGGTMMLFGWLDLPGNFVLRRGNVTVVFPLLTSLIVSVVLTILLSLLFRSR